MTLNLPVRERPAASLARVAANQLNQALDAVRPPINDRDVHRARQTFKQLRAMIRLLRPTLGDQARTMQRILREAGKTLAPQRDASVIAATLDRFHVPLPELAVVDPPTPTLAQLEQMKQSLQSLGPRFGGWSILRVKRKQLRQALKRTHRRTCRARRRALQQGTADAWHTWRKRVKDLWYQSQCLGVPGSSLRRLARLGHVLGQEHDLSMLEASWSTQAPAPKLREQINRRRAQLRQRARRLSRGLTKRAPRC